MTALPNDLKETLAQIIRTEGVKDITMKALICRLETKYQMSFEAHKSALNETLKEVMGMPDIQRQLAKAKAESKAGPIGGKKKRTTAKKEEAPKSKKKPADYPKPALQAYIIFGNQNREKLKSENPDISAKDILKRLGEMWSGASESVKEKYKKLAEEDKKRFDREMEKYKAEGGEEIGRKGKAKAVKEGPKRAKNAFMFFSAEFRAKNPGNIVEVSRASGAAWEKLSPAERRPYEEMAAKDKERYLREKAES